MKYICGIANPVHTLGISLYVYFMLPQSSCKKDLRDRMSIQDSEPNLSLKCDSLHFVMLISIIVLISSMI